MSRGAILVGVGDDQDAVAGFAFGNVTVGDLLPVVDDFANPNSAHVVDVDVGRIGQHRFCRKEAYFKLRMDVQLAGCDSEIVLLGVLRQYLNAEAKQKCGVGRQTNHD